MKKRVRQRGSVQTEALVEALRMIAEGRWSIRRAASYARVSYHEILDEMSKRGIDSGPEVKDLEDSLTSRHSPRRSRKVEAS